MAEQNPTYKLLRDGRTLYELCKDPETGQALNLYWMYVQTQQELLTEEETERVAIEIQRRVLLRDELVEGLRKLRNDEWRVTVDWIGDKDKRRAILAEVDALLEKAKSQS
jgi:hypothetical protein